MQESDVIHYAHEMLVLILLLSLPAIIAASVVGTVISIVQGLTQVQEQTIGFAAKLITVFATLYLTSDWYGGEIFQFSVRIMDEIAKVAGSGP